MENPLALIEAFFIVILIVVVMRQRARLNTFERHFERQRATIRNLKEATKKKPKRKTWWED